MEAAAPLRWNEALGRAARRHSEDMSKHQRLSHQGSDGSSAGERASAAGYKWQRIGENVGSGHGSAQAVVAGWLRSPGHCANLMNPQFTEMGGAYVLNMDSEDTIYWTQVLGRPR